MEKRKFSLVIAAAFLLLLGNLALPLITTAGVGPIEQTRLLGTTGTASYPCSTLVEITGFENIYNTVTVSNIGPIGHTVNALAYDPTTGKLFGSARPGCYTTPFGDFIPEDESIQLNGASYNGLIEINPQTGEATTFLNNWGTGTTQLINNLSINSQGEMFGWINYVGTIGYYDLVRIDKTTGVISPVGNSGITPHRHGLAFDNFDTLFLYQNGNVYTVSTSTGAATYQGYMSNRWTGHHGDFNPDNNLYYGIFYANNTPNNYIMLLDLNSPPSGYQNYVFVPSLSAPLHTLSFYYGDGDDIPPQDDNCPFHYNPGQEDADKDGVGDVCDNCPDTSNHSQADADNDDIGDHCDVCPNDPLNDDDNDRRCANDDNCPDDFNPRQRDSDLDGAGNVCDVCPYDAEDDADNDQLCGDVDNCPYDPTNDADGDRVCGFDDNCPNTYNPRQTDSDSDGLGDNCDVCPRVPDDQSDCNRDGIGDACDGDFDNDCDIDGLDISIIKECQGRPTDACDFPECDLNLDGKVDLLDIRNYSQQYRQFFSREEWLCLWTGYYCSTENNTN